jgi:hypothetical protein
MPCASADDEDSARKVYFVERVENVMSDVFTKFLQHDNKTNNRKPLL